MAKGKQGFLKLGMNDERIPKIMGLVLMFFAFYLLVSFTSYLFTWREDQDRVLQFSWGLLLEDFEMSNWLGRLGAIISNMFFYWGFGVSSFLAVFLLYRYGLALTQRVNLSFLNSTFRTTFMYMILSSAFFAFLFQKSNFPWGGAFGEGVAMWTQNLLGVFGTLFFILFAAFATFVWSTNMRLDNFSWKQLRYEFITRLEDIAAGRYRRPEPAEKTSRTKANTDEDGFDIPNPAATGSLLSPPNLGLPELTLGAAAVVGAVSPFEKVDTGDQLKLDLSQKSGLFNEGGGSLKPGDSPLEILPSAASDLVLDDAPIVPTLPENAMAYKPPVELVQENNLESMEPYDPAADLSSYEHPHLQLLNSFDDQKYEVDRGELEENKDQIIQTLLNFKIEIEKIRATIGPTVTLYEIVPAKGIRISKIKSLEDDIALNLSALGIRIIAPIPGKGTIGIEVPNKNRQIVGMKEVLMSDKFKKAKMDLPLVLGKTISNEVFVADLAKMPHLLIAGATGQGKSVGINVILMSLLYKKHPSQVKIVMIDPKKVELFPYARLENHFLGFLPDQAEPIVTDTTKVVHTLNSVIIEMDSRYDLMKLAECRNINEYNEKFVARRLNPLKGHKFMPFIVLIIDEFADLIMTAGKEIELPIGRLAQLARAVGIHLIIATQRPSVNIITGVIKANFPARIAYKVASKIDSRTILDSGGAEQLTGRGDMLLSVGGDIVRIQSAFVDTPEVEKVIDFIASQRGYPEPYFLPEFHPEGGEGGNGKSFSLAEMDDMMEDAGRLVVQSQHGSTSMIQRRLKLGYNRAGRIMDQLEALGIVGPADGSKPREVLYFDEMEFERFMAELKKKRLEGK
jgi:DNA segregation ATPase FtsK/SpoIIIE, S-DNA-T family